jgi:hypothetical protein
MTMTTNPADRACAACGITGQPLTVTRSRGIGEQDWRELWRCADITACHDRLFPKLTRLATALAAGAGCRRAAGRHRRSQRRGPGRSRPRLAYPEHYAARPQRPGAVYPQARAPQ